MTDIPKVVWEGSFKMGGQEIRCSVLDDGRRIIHADDLEKIFSPLTSVSDEEVLDFTSWSKGQ